MLRPREFNLTMPPPDDYYLVRDEELSSLSEAGKKIPLEISLASAGAALGLLQNVGLVIADIFNANVPSIWNLIASTLCIGLMVLAVTKGFEYRSARADIDATMKKIRDSGGRKVPVQHGEQTQQQI